MSASVDERIVKMSFDNRLFEENAKTSLSTIDRLKAALKLDDAGKSFSDLEISANSVKMDGLFNNVESLAHRFSTVGIIGMRMIENVTDGMMNLATRTAGYIKDGIVQGGWSRAMNIENAHFMLQGLLKDEQKVQEVMDQAGKSVDGTAYSYDSAAKAAAMFTSSGVTAGEKLETTLAALAGTAATANADYDRMAEIFTKVAGNGRLMGEELLQFSGYGMNAAATIASYFREVEGQSDMTETKVREMVSDSKIDFETFVTAMNWAFGDQAQKANETFTGALANIKAALARTGQGFFAPLLEQNSKVVKLFNSIRVKINEFNSMLGPIQESFTKTILHMAKDASKFIDSINMKKVSKAMQNVLYSIANVGSFIGKIVEPIKKAFTDIFPPKTINDILSFTSKIRYLTQNAEVTDMIFAHLYNTFHGVFSVVKIVGDVFSGLFSILGTIGSGFTSLLPNVLDLTASIGLFATSLKDVADETSLFGEVVKTVQAIIESVFSTINGLLDHFLNFLYDAVGEAGWDDPFASMKESMSGFADSAKTSLQNFRENLGDGHAVVDAFASAVGTRFNQIKDLVTTTLENLGGFPNIIKTVFTTISNVIKTVAGVVGTALSTIYNGLVEAFSDRGYSGLIDTINTFLSAGLGVMLVNYLDRITKAVQSFDSIKTAVTSTLKTLRTSLELIQAKVKADIIMDIAKAVAVLAGSLLVLSLINPDRLAAALLGVSVLMKEVIDAMVPITTMLKGDSFKDIAGIAVVGHAMVQMATALLILAGAVKIMGSMPLEDLAKGLIAVTWLLDELTIVASEMSKQEGQMIASAGTLIGMAIAINLLARAVKKLGEMKPEELIAGLGAVTVALMELAWASKFLSEFGSISAGQGFALIEMAAALMIMGAAVKIFGSMSLEELAKGLVAVGAALAEFGAAAYFIDGKKLAEMAGPMILMSSAMVILGAALKIFASMDENQIGVGLFTIAVALAEFGAAAKIMGSPESLMAAGAITIMSGALLLLAPALLAIGSIPIETTFIALASLAGVFMVLGAAAFVLEPVIVPILGLAAALTLLGVSVAAFGAGIVMIGAGITALAGAGTAAAAAAATIVTLVAGIVPAIATTIAQGIITFVTTIADGAAQIVEAVVSVISAILEGIMTLAPQIAQTAVVVISSFIRAAEVLIPQVVHLGMTLILSLLDGLAQNIGTITDKATDVITGFVDGVGRNMPRIIQSGIDLILNFINGLADGIRNNYPRVVDAVWNLVTAMVEALVKGVPLFAKKAWEFVKSLAKGITDKVGEVKEAAKDLIRKAINGIKEKIEDVKQAGKDFVNGFLEGVKSIPIVGDVVSVAQNAIGSFKGKKGLDENSPSKKTEEAGRYFVEGFVNGVDKNRYKVVKVTQELGNESVTVIDKSTKKVSEVVADNFGSAEEALKNFGKTMEDIGPPLEANTENLEANGKAVDEQKSKYKDGITMIDQAIEKQNQHTAALEASNKKHKENTNVMSYAAGAVRAYYEAYAYHEGTDATAAEMFKQSKNAVKALGEQLLAAKQASAEATTQTGEDAEKTKSHAEEVKEAFNEMHQQLEQNIASQVDIFGKWEQNSDMTKEELLKNLKQQLLGMTEWADNMHILGDRGVNEAVMDKLREMGPQGAQYAALLVSMSDKELTHFGSMAERLIRLPSSIADNLTADMANAAYQATAGFQQGLDPNAGNENATQLGNNTVDSLETALDEHSPSEKTKQAGLWAVEGFVNGIAEGIEADTPRLAEALQGMAETVTATLTEAINKFAETDTVHILQAFIDGIEDDKRTMLSKLEETFTKVEVNVKAFANKFKPAGEASMVGYAAGVKNKTGTVQSAMTTVIIAVINTVQSYNNIYHQLGEFITKGIAVGMVSNSALNWMRKAATIIVRYIIDSFSKEADEHSPSRKAMPLGEFFTKGIGEGMVNNAALRSISDATETIVDTMMDALEEIPSPSVVFGSFDLDQASLSKMNRVIDRISDTVNDTVDTNPIIVPELDLSRIEREAQAMNQMFNQVTLGINGETNEGNADSTNQNQNRGTTFIQNNYSPKALSRLEIYRDTSNLFAMAKDRVNA